MRHLYTDAPPLIASTARPSLAQALQLKLDRRSAISGRMGELEPLAVRLGLIQNTLRPRLRQPQLLVFAGDHGLAVDLATPAERTSATRVDDVLQARVPLPVFAHHQGLTLNLVDAGLATPMPVTPGVLARKIAHGTRNCRMAQAMSHEQLRAALRAGSEIADALPGNVLGCAALGLGSVEAAALVISRVTGLPLRQILNAGDTMASMTLEHHMVILQVALARHSAAEDPIEVLGAFGGFETAMMVGAMLRAAEKRHLILVDGLPACAALIVASHIASAMTDYCVFCRSSNHAGLDRVLAAFHSTALLALGMDSLDGTGIALSWPLLAAAASLLSDLTDEASDSADGPAPASQLDGGAFLTRPAGL
ncbi:MAG: nicotinate-nucleotide--dimethylbenzimidazole phosphoribosyltransferase [Leptothrix sp. (in: b-proteobacteria)]